MRPSLLFVALLAAVTSARASGQAATRDSSRISTPVVTHVLRTVQGSTFLGRLVQDAPGSDSVRFETGGAELVVARTAILSLTAVSPSDIHEGQYWFPNPNATRLFFAPTGRTLKRGEGYYSNTYLFIHGANVGVTDRLSIGGSVSLIPSSGEQLAYATPKVGVYESDNLNVSVGALLGYNGFGDDDTQRQFGILYSVATVGSADASATGGIGWGYQGSRLSSTPALMLGGAARMSRRTALVTENYYVSGTTDSGVFLSYGVRFFGEKLSVDFAFLNSATDGVFPGLPFVSFSVKF